MNQVRNLRGFDSRLSPKCPNGGIGRHNGLRNRGGNAWGFDSLFGYKWLSSLMDRAVGYEPIRCKFESCGSHKASLNQWGFFYSLNISYLTTASLMVMSIAPNNLLRVEILTEQFPFSIIEMLG